MPARIAALNAPLLPLQAVLRAEPGLSGTPVVAAEGAGTGDPQPPGPAAGSGSVGPRDSLVAVSAVARKRGLRHGMTVAQARNVCPEVVVRGASPAALASVGAVLAGVARGFSPRVEVAGEGWVYLDVAGLAMFEDEEAIRQGLLDVAAESGVEARAGIASSRGVARIAAQAGLGAVRPGGERRAIAPCRVELLFPPGPPFFGEELRERLAPVLGRWGVRRIGEFARLPVREVQRRLGAGGAALHRLARGIDETPLAPEPCPESFEEAWETFDEIADAERLLAVLNTLVKRVLQRIVLRRLHLARVRLEFTLEGGGKDDRTLELAAPTRDPAAALKLLRAELETRPLRAAVTAVRIGAEPVRARSAQASVFLPAGPAPEALNALLSRLGALCGEGRVGRPVVCDSLDPEAFEVAPFELPDLRQQLSAAPPGALALHVFRPWIAIYPGGPRRDLFTGRRAEPDRPAGGPGLAPGPPDPCPDPRLVAGAGRGGEPRRPAAGGVAFPAAEPRVVAGPFRLRAHWWTQWPIERDEYDLLLADGGLYRAVHDLSNDSWWLRGRYE